MQFELTKSYLEELKQHIDNGNETAVVEMIHNLHPVDIAEILNELNTNRATSFYQYIDAEKAAASLIELEDDVRERFLNALTSEAIAKDFIDNLDSDDAADVISELPDKRKEEVIASIEDQEQASDIVDLLNYDQTGSASVWGTGGRRFKSGHPDHFTLQLSCTGLFMYFLNLKYFYPICTYWNQCLKEY